jgi:hypothetical protein
MDALPPTNRTLDEMDAAARDMGIVPGDPAYAFYTGLRRLYAEQQAILSKILAAAEKQAAGALAARASAELPAAINRAILGRDRLLTAGIVLTVLVLGFGGGVLAGKARYSPPAELTCEVQRGGYVCFSWLRPATEEPAPAPQPQLQSPAQVVPKKAAAR